MRKRGEIFAIRLPESAHVEQVRKVDHIRLTDGRLVPVPPNPELPPLIAVGTEVLYSTAGSQLLDALDQRLAKSDPIDDLKRFITCVTHGAVPPPDVIRWLAAVFATYLRVGEPNTLELHMGLGAKRGKKPPVRAALRKQALGEALGFMMFMERGAGARIREAAALAAAKMQAKWRLNKGVRPLSASTLEYQYRRGYQDARSNVIRMQLSMRAVKYYLAEVPDDDLEVRLAKKRILANLSCTGNKSISRAFS